MNRLSPTLEHLSDSKIVEPGPEKATLALTSVPSRSTSSELQIRRLEAGDEDRGFLELLSQLTVTFPVSKAMFRERLEKMNSLAPTYNIMVVYDPANDRIAATAGVLVELKFVHSCGKVGHIEDVVVDETYRGQKLGARVVQACVEIAKQEGCYKVLLDCADHNIPFYEKMGFKKNENHLRLDLPH
jgi:glucosamine-phosphate N-acetyltransferase